MRWIPVILCNGRNDRLGILPVLKRAGEIRQIAASNPMDNVAIFRLLLAVLQWCRPNPTDQERAQLKGSSGIPGEWLRERLGDENAPNPTFVLMNRENPFLQDLAVADTKATPITNLLHEVPSGSNVQHFRHVRDFQSGLCPACSTMAMVRWTCYASAGTAGGGQSMTAAPNGNTPAYCQPIGSTLLSSLMLDWPFQPIDGDKPLWNGATESTPLGPLKGLTWRCRRMLICEGEGEQPGECLLCGEPCERLILSVRFRPGWKRPNGGWADDPHLLSVERANGSTVTPSGAGPNDPMEEHAGQWLLVRQGLRRRKTGKYRTTLVSSSQQLYKDAFDRCDSVFSEQPGLSAVVESLRRVLRATTSSRAGKREWKDPPKLHALAQALRHEKAKSYALRTSLASLDPALQRKLDFVFSQVQCSLNNQPNAESAIGTWPALLAHHLKDTVRHAVDSTVAGSPLRRQEARMTAESVINRQVRQLEEAIHENRDDIHAQ